MHHYGNENPQPRLEFGREVHSKVKFISTSQIVFPLQINYWCKRDSRYRMFQNNEFDPYRDKSSEINKRRWMGRISPQMFANNLTTLHQATDKLIEPLLLEKMTVRLTCQNNYSRTSIIRTSIIRNVKYPNPRFLRSTFKQRKISDYFTQ